MSPTLFHASLALAFSALSPASPVVGRALSLDTAEPPWFAGFSHPLLDATQFLVLLTLGFVAAQFGRRSRWGLFVMFAALMSFGVILALQGAIAPMSDIIVLTTALCFGLLILGRVHLRLATVASVAGAYALFHGVNDGSEVLRSMDRSWFAVGLLTGNAAGYAFGLVIGEWTHRHISIWTSPIRDAWSRWRGRLLGT
jgi:hydrogenase/urease accessory protein HupE